MPARQGRLDSVRDALADLGVHELPFPEDAAARLAQLRASTNRKMPECCVLLAAEQTHARLASFDDALIQAASARNIPTGC